jgi:folate-binding protein YgfZ
MSEAVLKHLDRYLISEQVELTDELSDFAQFHLAGPHAGRVLESACGGTLRSLSLFEHTCQQTAEASCQIRRHDPLALPGFDIIVPSGQAGRAWRALIKEGAKPAGWLAYEIRRVEAGTPVYGVDIDENNLPQEVGRTEQAVSFTKGCYIGQETIARIRTYGHVNRLLVGLRLSDCRAVPRGSKLMREGKEVGQVTSSVQSPRLGPIAMGYVRRGSQDSGTHLEVVAHEKLGSAEVASLPFVGSGADGG